MKRLGLEVVESGAADLDLQIGIVDLNASRTYAYVAYIDPFIELEVRLTDAKAKETLLLLRNQEHGGTPEAAAGDFAGQMAKFLK